MSLNVTLGGQHLSWSVNHHRLVFSINGQEAHFTLEEAGTLLEVLGEEIVHHKQQAAEEVVEKPAKAGEVAPLTDEEQAALKAAEG